MPMLSPMPPMPVPPGGFPPLDPNNPLAAMMAMQAMGLPPLPGFPGLPSMGSPTAFSPVGGHAPGRGGKPTAKTGERCKDYDTKGFCALGSSCPYEHGTDPIVIPGQSEGNYVCTEAVQVANEIEQSTIQRTPS